MCGVFGIIHSPQAAEEVFLGLQNLQHRGQDGGGIAVLSQNQGVLVHRGKGLVDIAFPKENFLQLSGSLAIGHTRYGTTGSQSSALLQPFVSKSKDMAIAHNGNLVNYYPLQDEFKGLYGEDCLTTQSDSELILCYLSAYFKTHPKTPEHLFEAIAQLSQKLVGSYSVVGFIDQLGLFAFRDPKGLRPLIMGKRQTKSNQFDYSAQAFASESAALEFLGFGDLVDVEPGQVVLLDFSGQTTCYYFSTESAQHCMFEWVYFARVESTIDHLPVYRARFNLGLALANTITNLGIQPDIVVPVPETSRIAAIALAESLQLPFREVLIKNRYVNRTFILESQTARLEAIGRKLYPVADELRGKSVLVVDDSIVRGNTAIKIVDLIRQAGARSIVLASTCPPIQHPCYYGIDFPSSQELLAAQYPLDHLAQVIGVDQLVYQTMEGLYQAISNKPLCVACLNGQYPTSITEGSYFSKHREQDREEILK